ncbi:ParA family protein [Photobacterium leiognathi]|uniref:ParA family protein n=1 Tax=Photobacterium leiognathi TaxID=553611 RepID=UPI00273A0079|nr:ParA family protein [Photobacterium leiognathi]
MNIIDIWNPKGGQGKSMFAINLAGAALELGRKPLVICQDPQGTSTLYYKYGKLPFEVMSEVPKFKPDADVIIFDHQASDWDVPQGNLIVMPVKPSRDQYATYIDAYKKAKAMGKKIVTIVTDTQMQRPDEKSISLNLVEKGAFFVPSSGVFSRAATDYLTIFDDELNRAYKVKERRRELCQIMTEILVKNI